MVNLSKRIRQPSKKALAHTILKAGKRRGTDAEIDEEELSVSVTRRRKKAKQSVETEEEDDEVLEIEEVDMTAVSPSDDSDEVRHYT
jgi:hypothetical protein